MGALGGIIRVQERAIPDTPGTAGRVDLNAFSNDGQGAGALSIERGSAVVPGLGWRLQGSLRKAGDMRTPDYVVGNTAFVEAGTSASVGYSTDTFSFKGTVGLFQNEHGIYDGAFVGNVSDLYAAIDRGEPPFSYTFGYGIRAPRQESRHNRLSLRLAFHPSTAWHLEVLYGRQLNTQEFFETYTSVDPFRPASMRHLDTHVVLLKAQNRKGKTLTTIGLNARGQSNRNEGFQYAVPNYRAIVGGVFLNTKWEDETLTLDAGIRVEMETVNAYPYDRESATFYDKKYQQSSITTAFELNYVPSSEWSISGSVGTAWRPPGIHERYFDGIQYGSARYLVGDPRLTSERSLNLETTLRHVINGTRMEISVYRNSIRRYIFLEPDPEPTHSIQGAFPTFRYDQADAVIQGIEAFCRKSLSHSIDLTGTASLLRGERTDMKTPLFLMPADRFELSCRYRLRNGLHFINPYVNLNGRFVRKQTHVRVESDYAPPPDGYVLIDIDFGTTIKLGNVYPKLSLSVRNALNKSYRDYLSRYRYFVDDIGRNVVLRITIPFGKDMDS